MPANERWDLIRRLKVKDCCGTDLMQLLQTVLSPRVKVAYT